jgi:cell division protein FtsA
MFAMGVDAGSRYTRCVIGLVEEAGFRLLGYGRSAADGWIRGRIADQELVSQSILQAVEKAEQRAQASVESAVLGMGGTTIQGANSRGLYEIGRQREFDQQDVDRSVQRASHVLLAEDRMILQLFPQHFTVDGRPGHRNPRGAIGSKLDARVHLVMCSVQEHQSLIGAANQAHLWVEETVFEPVAAAYAAVLPEDRREGIALVDIGAHSTDLVVYYGEALILAASLPICGDHFTRDVGYGLRIASDDAERVKVEYGCAILGLSGGNSLIELPSPEDRQPRETPRHRLIEILEPRAEELFQLVRRELAKVDMERDLMGGIVLTGGGALLPGMCDMAELVLNCQARNGLAIGIEGWPEEINTADWTTVAGLAMYSARLKMHTEVERKSAGLLARILR